MLHSPLAQNPSRCTCAAGVIRTSRNVAVSRRGVFRVFEYLRIESEKELTGPGAFHDG